MGLWLTDGRRLALSVRLPIYSCAVSFRKIA